MFGAPPSVGDHVRLREQRSRWLGPDAKRNALAIVRETHYGLLTSDVTVELADGTGRIRVPARTVRRTGARGDRGAYGFARDWHRAKLFAGALLAIPMILGLARFFIARGHPSQLVMPVISEILNTAFAILAGPFGAVALIVLIGLVLRHRSRGR